ncbi:peroxisomal catalase [Colletotrichum tofieldiae]|uniref:Peroxisomal catalase n=1 Tax=Colletotrichum tofieldiae TaxID=708197 RepID=A0A166TD59_9PEZI|nr:peroxisomal catalase [Colletotrichum tofieldiae]
MEIDSMSLLRSLRGVAQAAKLSEAEVEPIIQRLSSLTGRLTFTGWQAFFESLTLDEKNNTLHLTSLGLALAVSFLRETARHNQAASPDELDQCWGMVYRAIASKDPPVFTAARSAQGFLSIALCSLVKDGSIDELFRLHVWLPDGRRGNSDFRLHSHQPFAQSWILAGEGVDHAWKVEQVGDPAEATHAGYALAWDDGNGQNKAYKTHQSSSTVKNTGKLFKATETHSEVHRRASTYSIPAAAFHTSEVAPDALHATIFFFDSYRGFIKDAGVLGPKDKDSYTQLRDPAGISPCELAEAVEVARSREL